MTKIQTTALLVATAALSPPSCTTALSLLPRQRNGPVQKPPINTGHLFGRKSAPSSRPSTQQWMLPSFQQTKFLLSQQLLRATTKDKEEEEAASVFFAEETDEKVWAVKPPNSPPPESDEKDVAAMPVTSTASSETTIAEQIGSAFISSSDSDDSSEPSVGEQILGSQLVEPLLNPTIIKDVPFNTIMGAAANGSFLTLLTSLMLFGVFSISKLSTLVAAASAGIIAAYISITEGTPGDFYRGLGKSTVEVTEWALDKFDEVRGEKEIGKVANALLEKPKVSAPAKEKSAPKKKRDEKVVEAEDSMPLTEGLTAEEAEEVRTARVTGGGRKISAAKATDVAEGQTGEEAAEAREARLDAADEAAKTLNIASVDYDAGARLAFEAAGSPGAFDDFKATYLEETSAMVAKKFQDAIAAEDKAARVAAEMKEAEARAKAATEEEARLRAEEEARAAAEEQARLKAEEEAQAAEEQRLLEERALRAEDEARAKAAEAQAKAAAEELARLKAEEEAQAAEEQRLLEEQALRAEEEARAKAAEAQAKAAAEELAQLKAEEEAQAAEEQRLLAEQAEAAREAVRVMEEQEALMSDDDGDDDELDDDDWEAAVALANELQGTPSPSVGGDVMDDIGDDLLQMEIDSLTTEEEDALGKAAREAVRKYEEEMAMKKSEKQAVRSSWDDEMVGTPSMTGAFQVEAEDAPSGPAATVDYSKMTVAKLKDELRSRGLKVSGKKAELIERLQDVS